MTSKPLVIAEVKTISPFGYKSSHTWRELFNVANEIGDIISIHTDARWDGSYDLIKQARELTDKPILAKGIHKTDKEIQLAIDAGATYVLVVGRIPAIHLNKCFLEPNSLADLMMLPKGSHAVWNSRDLSHGGLKSETFEQAREIWRGWLCQASNIVTIDDIKKEANAVLVGTHLYEFAESLLNR